MQGFDTYYQNILEDEAKSTWPDELYSLYLPLSCLASDDKGAIFTIKSRETGKKYILRISKRDFSKLAKYEHEILGKINDERIPKAIALYEKDGTSYLIREYMEGQTLYDYVIENGLIKERELISISLSILDILGLLHSMQPPVIHRDIKPQNIIIDGSGNIKLVDFGIARTHSDDKTSDTVAIGTRPYMAPEQFGGAQTDARSDLFSLGVVMIFLATGKSERTNIQERFPIKRLAKCVAKLVSPDPEYRYQSAKELRRKLVKEQKGYIKALYNMGLGLILALLLAMLAFYVGRNTGIEEGVNYGFEHGEVKGSEDGYRKGYDEGYKKAADDARMLSLQNKDRLALNYFDEGETNASGNLLYGGFATKGKLGTYIAGNDKVYLKDNEGNFKLILDISAKNIQIYEERLYFAGEKGIYSADLYGEDLKLLLDCRPDKVWLSDSKIYYTDQLDDLRLYSADTDGSNKMRVSDKKSFSYASIKDGYIYFCPKLDGATNRIVCKMNLLAENAEFEIINRDDANWLNVAGDRLFYITYTADGSKLVSCMLNGDDRIVCDDISPRLINVSPYGVYYPDSINRRLKRCSLDGLESAVISDIAIGQFCIVGDEIYYISPEDELFVMNIDGSNHQKIL